jgi:hypothetical protein
LTLIPATGFPPEVTFPEIETLEKLSLLPHPARNKEAIARNAIAHLVKSFMVLDHFLQHLGTSQKQGSSGIPANLVIVILN